MSEPVTDPLGFVLGRSRLAREDDLPTLLGSAAELLGALDVVIYLVDISQTRLVSLAPAVTDRRVLSVERTLAGRAFRDITTQTRYADDTVTVWEPLLDGSERLGVVELTFPRHAHDERPDLVAACQHLTALAAELIVSRQQYGDVVARSRRLLPMQLPAELQWNLLPPLTFATPQVVISGTVEPAYEVGGDSFDYAVNGDIAHMSIIDAMGHGLGAALLATVSVGALRNARRSGLDLVDTVRSMGKWLGSQFGPEVYVTAIVGELHTSTGHYRWINAGHPPALLLREGRVVKTLSAEVNPPLNVSSDMPSVAEERLQPGDRMLLYSDGVIEARSRTGEFFGTTRLADFVTRAAAAGLPAPETLRRLNLAILQHQDGNLQDDATTLLVEWSGAAAKRLAGG
jgi:serine phosphatase RsbU (regulator of sigma subunit)